MKSYSLKHTSCSPSSYLTELKDILLYCTCSSKLLYSRTSVMHSMDIYDAFRIFQKPGYTEYKQIHNSTSICIIQKALHVQQSVCVLLKEKIMAHSEACIYIWDEGLCPHTTAVYSGLLSTLRFHSMPSDTHCLCSHPVYCKVRFSQTVPPLAQACLYLADSLPSIILWLTWVNNCSVIAGNKSHPLFNLWDGENETMETIREGVDPKQKWHDKRQPHSAAFI